MADDFADEIVKEYDVILSKPPSRNLFVFQYPIRSKQLGYDDAAYRGCKVKPHQQKVELELALNTASSHYSRSKGEQIAINADSGSSSSAAKHFPNLMMDKQLLTSTVASISTSQYVIGVIEEDELRVMPLNAVLQLRPSFNYLDKAGPVEKDVSKGMEDDASHDEDEEAKVVSVKFARQETDEAKARRMATYDYLQQKQEEEPWVNMRFHGKGDYYSQQERDLVCSAGMSSQSNFTSNTATISVSSYVERLLPKTAAAETARPSVPEHEQSLVDLRKLSLSEQVKTLLKNAKVMRFSQLLSLLPRHCDVTNVLKYVQQVAVLVQGCWVVKSEILYPAGSRSANNGTSAEKLCLARDYVLSRFNQCRFLYRNQVPKPFKVEPDDLEDIFKQFSKKRPSKGWEFNYEFDSEFTCNATYKDVVDRQLLIWVQIDNDLKEKGKDPNGTLTEPTKGQASGSNTKQSPVTARRRRKSSTCNNANKSASAEESGEQDVDGLGAVNCGLESAAAKSPKKPARRRSSAKQHENGANTDEDDVKVTIQNAAKVKVEPMAVDNSVAPMSVVSDDVEMTDLNGELRKFVTSALSAKFVLSLSSLRNELSVYLLRCAEGHVLSRAISDEQLSQCVGDVGGVVLHTQYFPEVIFAWPRVGDKHDNVRSVIIDLLRLAPKVRLTTLKEKLDEKSMARCSDNDLRTVLRDYCESKSGFWQIKCVTSN